MSKLMELQNRAAEILARQEELNKVLGDEDRLEFNEKEQTEWDGLEAEFPKVEASMAREQSLLDRKREMAAARSVVPPGTVGGDGADALPAVAHDSDERPFRTFGEQMQAIVLAENPGGEVDPRLMVAALGGQAGVPSDGGFLIQKEFAVDIFNRAYEQAALASRCDRIPIGEGKDGAEVVTITETSRATGSRWGGVRVYRTGEAVAATKSKPVIGKWKLDLEDLTGLAYATDRMLEDAALMGSVYQTAFSNEFAFVLDDELYRGTGVGQCQGIKVADCTVTVDKETGQAAATIVYENINKMWSRMWAKSRANAVWFINQDCEPALDLMSVPVGTGGLPVYLPAGGVADVPYARLKGRPVIPIEHCDTLGTKGDICLADLSQYALIDKDGLKSDVSMHVRFITHEQTFRFKMRINGKPKWSAALTPYKGTNTVSPFIMLAVRS